MPHKIKEEYNAYHKAYQLKRYHERRKEALELLGGKCNKCGKKENLEIDHIDYMQKSCYISKIWSMKDEIFFIELSKCQLLCKVCHLEKTRSEGSLN